MSNDSQLYTSQSNIQVYDMTHREHSCFEFL